MKYNGATSESRGLRNGIAGVRLRNLLDARLVGEGDVEGLDVHLGAVVGPDAGLELRLAGAGAVLLGLHQQQQLVAALDDLVGRLLLAVYRHPRRALGLDRLEGARLGAVGAGAPGPAARLGPVLLVAPGGAALQPGLLPRRVAPEAGPLHRLCARAQARCCRSNRPRAHTPVIHVLVSVVSYANRTQGECCVPQNGVYWATFIKWALIDSITH